MATPFDAINSGVDRARQDNAYNALQRVYGDPAGNPQAAAILQNSAQSAEAQPYVLRQKSALASQEESKAAQEQQITTLSKQNAQQGALLNGSYYIQNALDAAAPGSDLGALAVAKFDEISSKLGLDPAIIASTRADIAKDPSSVKGFIAAFSPRAKPTTPSGALPAAAIQEYDYRNKLSPEQQQVFDQNKRAGFTGQAVIGGVPSVVTRGPGPSGGPAAAQPLSTLPAETAAANAKKLAETSGGELGKGIGEKAASDLPLSKTERAKAKLGLHAASADFDTIEDNIDKAMGETGAFSSGVAARTSFIGGTPAANLKARLTTIASNNVLGVITQLKELSKTGSTGFGQLSDREGTLIQSKLAAVDQSTSPSFLKQALSDLKTQIQRSRKRVEDAYQDDLDARGEAPASGGNAPRGGRVEGSSIGVDFVRNPQTGKLEPAK